MPERPLPLFVPQGLYEAGGHRAFGVREGEGDRNERRKKGRMD